MLKEKRLFQEMLSREKKGIKPNAIFTSDADLGKFPKRSRVREQSRRVQMQDVTGTQN